MKEKCEYSFHESKPWTFELDSFIRAKEDYLASNSRYATRPPFLDLSLSDQSRNNVNRSSESINEIHYKRIRMEYKTWAVVRVVTMTLCLLGLLSVVLMFTSDVWNRIKDEERVVQTTIDVCVKEYLLNNCDQPLPALLHFCLEKDKCRSMKPFGQVMKLSKLFYVFSDALNSSFVILENRSILVIFLIGSLVVSRLAPSRNPAPIVMNK